MSKDAFVNKYIEYIEKLETVSDIKSFDNLFYQLILFVHPNTEQFNDSLNVFKLRDNCLYVNKNFQPDIKFYDHGHESLVYIRYIQEFCPSEITSEIMNNSNYAETMFGCNFRCFDTFNLISEKLKKCGYSKDKLVRQQEEVIRLKYELNNDPMTPANFASKSNEYDEKMNKLKKDIIIVKNICLFRKLVEESKFSTNKNIKKS